MRLEIKEVAPTVVTTNRAAGLVFVSLCLLVSAGISCRQSGSSAVLGKWQEIGGTETMEFFEDGRVAITESGRSVAGTWTLLRDGRVRIEAAALGITNVILANVEGESLVLRSGERSATYSRFRTPAERLVGTFIDPIEVKWTFHRGGTFTYSPQSPDTFSGTYEFLPPDSPWVGKGAEILAWVPRTKGTEFCRGPLEGIRPKERAGMCPMFMRLVGDTLDFLDIYPGEGQKFFAWVRLVRQGRPTRELYDQRRD